MHELLNKGLSSLRERGVGGTLGRVASSLKGRIRRRADRADCARYAQWLRRFDAPSEEGRRRIARRIGGLEYRPLISVLMPVYNTPEVWLRRAIESVRRQLYPHWELCIADDASTESHVRKILDTYAAQDARIKIFYRERNGHISAASNSALELAGGEFVALLDHDDELRESAFYYVAAELNRNRDVDLIYTDNDVIDTSGTRSWPYFKPDWSPDLLLSHNYILHLAVYRTDLVRSLGGFREGYEGSQDYDLLLRVTEQVPVSHIRHIPRVLYHWRSIPGSVAQGTSQKEYTVAAAVAALTSHLERTQGGASVESLGHHRYRIQYDVPATLPLVTIVVAGGGADIEKIRSNTNYSNCDIAVLSCATASSLNEAAKHSEAELLLFLDGACSPDHPDWLRELVSHAIRPEVGAASAKIVDAADRIVHAGMILGAGDDNSAKIAQSAFRGLKQTDRRALRLGRSHLVQNFSAVSKRCLMMRRKVFEELHGFDESNTPNTFYDIDLCLRLWEAGYRVLLTPFAILRVRGRQAARFESGLRRSEIEYMQTRWRPQLRSDPYYNPNLDLERGDYDLAFPPRTEEPL